MNKYKKALADIKKDPQKLFFHWQVICQALEKASAPICTNRVKIRGVYETNLEKCKIDLEEIIREKGYLRGEIFGRKRDQFVCDKRRVICINLYNKGYSLSVIGAAMLRDRTTVSNYIIKKQQKSKKVVDGVGDNL